MKTANCEEENLVHQIRCHEPSELVAEEPSEEEDEDVDMVAPHRPRDIADTVNRLRFPEIHGALQAR